MFGSELPKFSVLFTHQKTKKAKTWQDGILKVITGTKALLCDEQSKTLDSIFVRQDQVAPGDELESERYLITVEERLPTDHNPEVSLDTQGEQLKGPERLQTGKRKRVGFKPPQLLCNEPTCSNDNEPDLKKLREECLVPRQGLGIRKGPPSKQDFFKVYSRNNKAESDVNQPASRNVLHDNTPSALQSPNIEYPVNTRWEQRDQRVPFSMAGGCGGTGKENQPTVSPLPPKYSSFHCLDLRTNTNSCSEGKRNSAQILALFSSKTKPQAAVVSEKSFSEQSTYASQEKRPFDVGNDKLSREKDMNVFVPSSNIGDSKWSTNSVDAGDANEVESSQGLFDSFDFSPDSFAASSNEGKEAKLLHQNSEDLFNEPGGSSAGHDLSNGRDQMKLENDTFTKTPCNGDSQTYGWSQDDSESVSPLLRHLSAIENQVRADGHLTCVDLNDKCQEPSSLITHANCSSQMHRFDSNTAITNPVLNPAQQIREGLGLEGSLNSHDSNTVTDPDWSQTMSMLESNGSDLNRHTVATSNDVYMGQESVSDSRVITDNCIFGRQTFSSHIGSLFEYNALHGQEIDSYPDPIRITSECHPNPIRIPSGSSVFENGYSSCGGPSDERAAEVAEGTILGSVVSPEFHPLEAVQRSEWQVSNVVQTRVISNDSRSVKAGDGHSWKGSVVSDTVKREYPSVPMVSVRRQDTSAPNNGDHQAPCTDYSWMDCIPSSDINADMFLLSPAHFATSESIALSSTEGYMPSSQTTGERFSGIPEFVQRVPTMARRRTPLLTGPSQDSDDHQDTHSPTVGISINDEQYPKCSDDFTEHHLTAASEIPVETPVPTQCPTFSDDFTEHLPTAASETAVEMPMLTHQGRNCLANNLENVSEKMTARKLGLPRRVDLRRVGSGRARDLPGEQRVQSQLKGQLRNRPDGYQPPTTPGFMAIPTACDRNMAGELFFPAAEQCDSSVTPTRHVTVPVTFENVMQYRQVFKAALREHLNIVLFELARTYHSALQKVDVSGFSSHQQGSCPNSDGPCCSHGQARLRAVKKDGPNKGRLFYTCPAAGQAQCKFFKWADEHRAGKCGSTGTGQNSTNKVVLSSSDSLTAFFRSHNVAFYCDCHLIRKQSDRRTGKFGAGKAKKWGGKTFGGGEGGKKGLYLELPRKESSSVYSKDDIWIISKNLSFNPESTFVASSAYYGPSSSGELEIVPISGYSPSNWQSGETTYALMACNAGTELTCISNIEEHVKTQNVPVLPHLLHRNGGQTTEPNRRTTSRTSSFVPPMLRASGGQLNLPWEVVESLAEEKIALYNLNKDQALALHSCAKMFHSSIAEDSPPLPVCLIHGVFGAGKSFLLAVVVLFLVELFNASDSLNQQSNAQSPWKVLVSSTTNVAVDRILLGLLELEFEEFVRVGSVRKIAKPVLPYSVHSTGSDSQELRELQAMLKGELTPSERTYVRKSIERHKLGENKKRLSQVRVVGVTCAACVFPCLDRMKFPVLLLDECSQMTEPASLLPLARFECQKLVLVGDPKQLSPTIQGSEPEHEAGLEQTMFDRLIKMGYEPTLLRTQYRCHPTISALSNRLFYNKKLIDGVTAEDRCRVVDIVPTLCFYNVAKGKEKCGRDGSYYNEEEAKFVVFLIECLLESGVEPAQIGVITLYKSQLHTISNNLTASRATSHAELKTIQISTVDAFQGGEKDLTILSCVRTDHVGFIDCDRRTNVALTRAKRHLLIVGNLKMLSCNTVWGKVIEQCRDSPDGLCNATDFVEKCNKAKEMTGRLEEDSSRRRTIRAEDTSSGKDKPVLEDTPSVSPSQFNPLVTSSSNEESEAFTDELCCSDPCKEIEMSPVSIERAPTASPRVCTDILGVSDAVQEDSDDELPTFDFLSSIGI